MTSKVIEGHKSSIIKFCLSFFGHTFFFFLTFIYESILIKIYMNANYYDKQIFNFNKYDLKVHWRSQKFNNQVFVKIFVPFFFSLLNTFIYESILIKIYMKANIMNTQLFYFNKYDLKGHWRSQKFNNQKVKFIVLESVSQHWARLYPDVLKWIYY